MCFSNEEKLAVDSINWE